MANKVKADFVEQKIAEENWGVKKFLEHYNLSEEQFISDFKKQYKFTPVRSEELIEKMKENDANSQESGIIQEILNVDINSNSNISEENCSSDEMAILNEQAENCKVELENFKVKFNKLNEENAVQYEKLIDVRKNIEELQEKLNEKEAEVHRISNEISENVKSMETYFNEIAKCSEKISKIKDEIESKQVVKIFCGTCNNAENYTEVWNNGMLGEDEIRSYASNYSVCPEMDRFEDLSVKQLRNAVEFFMIAKEYEENNNKKIEYTFEDNNLKEVFEVLRSITIE